MTTIRDLIDLFILDRTVYCAPDSIRYYQDALTLFADWCDASGLTGLPQLNQDTLKRYAVYLRAVRRIKATSIKTYFRALNAMIKFAIDNDYLPPLKYQIRLQRPDPELVLPLSAAEVKQLITAAAASGRDSLRNTVVIRLMLDCGLRSSEVRHLQVADVDIPGRLIYVNYSKCNKSRMLPMPDVVAQLLAIYLGSRPHTGSLLLGSGRREISANAIKQLFQRLKLSSGVDRVHAHLLRHTFATSYMMQHSNLEYLRVYMGHESYDVTRSYIQLAAQCTLTHYDCYKIDSCFV